MKKTLYTATVCTHTDYGSIELSCPPFAIPSLRFQFSSVVSVGGGGSHRQLEQIAGSCSLALYHGRRNCCQEAKWNRGVERGAQAHLRLLWRPILDLPISPNGAKGRGREGEMKRETAGPFIPPPFCLSLEQM